MPGKIWNFWAEISPAIFIWTKKRTTSLDERLKRLKSYLNKEQGAQISE